MNNTAGVKPNLNITEEDDTRVLGVFYLLMSVLVMSANGVVISVIVKTRELHLPTLWVLTNMAVWDFLYGLHFLIFAVPSAFLNRFAYPEQMLGPASYLLRWMSSQNMLNIFVVVLDRCIAVKWPLKYTRTATKGKYTVLVAGTYVLSTTMLCDLEVTYNTETAVSFPQLKSSFQTSYPVYVFFATTLAIIVCLIIALRDIKHGKPATGQGSHVFLGKASKHTAKSSLMVFLITMAYFAVTIPGIVNCGLRSVYKDGRAFSWLSRLFMVTVLSNSLWNVFIYTATYRPFREALCYIFCRAHHRRQRQAEILATFRAVTDNVTVTLHRASRTGM